MSKQTNIGVSFNKKPQPFSYNNGWGFFTLG